MARLRKELNPLFLNDSTLKILHSKKIYTIVDFLQHEPEILATNTTLKYMDIVQFKHMLNRNFGAFPTNSLQAYKDLIDHSAMISCGIPRVDALLGGGLMTGDLLEICGLSGSGKTQFCHTIAVSVALKLKQKLYYIDSKNDFSATRMQSILDAFGLKDEDLGMTLEKIQVLRTTSASQLLSAMPKLYQDIQNEGESPSTTRVLIIDSLPSLFYPYMRDSSSIKAFAMLNSLGIALKQLACDLHVAVVMVNLATLWREDDDESSCGYEQELKPAFGKLWLSVPNVRLCMTRDDSASFVRVSVVKSTRLQINGYCDLQFSDKGLE